MIKKTLVTSLCFALLGCVGGDSDDAPDYDFLGMMANYADNILLPTLDEFSQSTAQLDVDLASYCAAIGSATEMSARSAAQDSFLSAMSTWQTAEMMLLGPLADNDRAIRNQIYSYASATRNPCAIDQAIVLSQNDGFNLANRSLNHRGLDSLEYLLFNDDLTHRCPSRITETVGWNDLPENERKQQRCEYARLTLADINNSVDQVDRVWAPDLENYRSTFLNPNNLEDSLKALSDALFYIEIEVKDLKVGEVSGVNPDCSRFSCPDLIESAYAQQSFEYITKNIEAFSLIFEGGEGLGFADLIIHSGFPEVATKFRNNISAVLTLLNGMESTLIEQVNQIDTEEKAQQCANASANPDTLSPFPVCNVHGLLVRITNDLKSDFVTIVNLDLPDRAQSDND